MTRPLTIAAPTPGRQRAPGRYRLMEQIAADSTLEEAYHWLCRQRKHHHHNADVWDLRWRWDTLKPQLQGALLSGAYRLDVVKRVRVEAGVLTCWSARDALVLKAVSLVLTRLLAPRLSPRCAHVVGRGGLKAAVRSTAAAVPAHTFVYKSDVKGYYASIDHDLLYGMVERVVRDPRVLDLVWRWLRHVVDDGGHHTTVQRGISLGCSLSPLMGALFLAPLDAAMSRTGLYYQRFMDDWVVLSRSRWKLRRAIAACQQVLAALKLTVAEDKTWVGRVGRGFDFLGYRLGDAALGEGALGVAEKTVDRMLARAARLYEQHGDGVAVGEYVRRWVRWVRAGVGGLRWNNESSLNSQFNICPTHSWDQPLSAGDVQSVGWEVLDYTRWDESS